MFTGLVEGVGEVLGLEPRGTGLRLTLGAAIPGFQTRTGASISVSGACLSVVSEQEGRLAFDLSAETLARTRFASLRLGERLNLERALLLSSRLDGHMVSGHIDAVGTITGMYDSGDGGRWLEVEVPPDLERFLVDKGSITVDGISLTVVRPKQRRFQVALIPLTLEHTNLGAAEVGQAVNLEADLVAKWIDRLRTSERKST
jgi:riboflavin synthase